MCRLPPTWVVTSSASSCSAVRAQLEWIAEAVHCVGATPADTLTLSHGSASLKAGARVALHWPPVHETFRMGPQEVAILLSHLRAVHAGLSAGAPFLVLEENIDLGLLLAAPACRLQKLLQQLPAGWHVLQLSVVTQKAYQFALLHLLAAQRSSVLLAAAKRSTLLGLGWPFTDWRNKSTSGWVKPYWTAGAYMVSPAGAKTLLATYWPDAPSMGAGVVIDTRSQKYAGADQLLFNSSDAYVGAPLVVKHEQGVCKRWKPDCTREVVWDLEVRSRSRRFVLLSYYGSLWPKLNLSSVPLRVVALAPPAAIAIAQGAASSSGFGDEQASTAGVLSRIPFHRLVPVAQSGPRPIRTVMRTAREAGAVEGWVGGPAAPRYTLLIDADVVTLGTFGGATGPSTNLSGGADLRRLASTRSAPIVEAQPETPTARAVKRLIQEAVLHATTTMPRSNSDIGMLVQRYGGPTRCNRECDPLFSSLKLLDAEEGDAIAKYAYGRAISLVAKLEAAELLANAPNLPQCCDPPGGRGGRARRMAALLVRTERFDAVAEAVAKADAQCSPHNAEGGSGQCDDSWEATMIRLGAVSASWFDRQGE